MEDRGRTLSRKLGLPVLKAPSQQYRKQVSNPGSCSSIWLSEDLATVLKTPLSFYVDGCDAEQAAEARSTEQESIELVEREKEIYRHLGSHARILSCLDICDQGLKFSYMSNGNLRNFLRSDTSITPDDRLQWVESALDAITFIHAQDVLQCDISTRNFLVTDNQGILLCDFSGSAIRASSGLVRPETRYEKQSASGKPVEMCIEMEIFAAGSLVYEIITGLPPYAELSDEEVESHYRQATYPDTRHMVLGKIVSDCWLGKFETMEQVKLAVQHAIAGTNTGRIVTQSTNRLGLVHNVWKLASSRLSSWMMGLRFRLANLFNSAFASLQAGLTRSD